MFKKQPAPETALDVAIDQLHREMTGWDGHSDQYVVMADQLTKLYALKASNAPERVSKETLATIFGNLGIVGIIIGFEQKHLINTKALSFIPKLR